MLDVDVVPGGAQLSGPPTAPSPSVPPPDSWDLNDAGAVAVVVVDPQSSVVERQYTVVCLVAVDIAVLVIVVGRVTMGFCHVHPYHDQLVSHRAFA